MYAIRSYYVLNEITQVDDLPDELVHELFNDLLLKGHPLARPVGGTVETVSSLERSDLLAYYRRRYCSRNLVITAAGDLEHQQIVDVVARTFAELPSRITSYNVCYTKLLRSSSVTGSGTWSKCG